jgi:hypothetical protein
MQIEQMTNGVRVQIVHEIDLWPVGKFTPGLLGTVQVIDGDGITEPFCLSRLPNVLRQRPEPEFAGCHARLPACL